MAPTQFIARVTANRRLTGGYFILELSGQPTDGGGSVAAAEPGQFVMLRGEWGRELLNPRAFSVLHVDPDGCFSVMLKAYGRGTTRMKALRPDDSMTVTGPLGRPFPGPRPGVAQILVAGGVGLPPLHFQARRAHALGVATQLELYYGGRDRDDLVLLDDFAGWDVRHVLATEDGSAGTKGFVTVPLAGRVADARARGEAIELLACGPTPMLAAVRKLALEHDVDAWLCLEEQMACGFGVCLGCAVPVHGPQPYRYCCTDGPVFTAKEVRWP